MTTPGNEGVASSYTWLDGTPYTYMNWITVPAEPMTFGAGGVTCVHIDLAYLVSFVRLSKDIFPKNWFDNYRHSLKSYVKILKMACQSLLPSLYNMHSNLVFRILCHGRTLELHAQPPFHTFAKQFR